MNPEYPKGFDYAWYALDEEEHLAAFTTADYGPVPLAALQDPDLAESLHLIIQSLPRICDVYDMTAVRKSAKILPPAKKLSEEDAADCWFNWAACGVFAFEWADAPAADGISQYKVMARPVVPLLASALPVHCQAYLTRLRLPGVRFLDSRLLDIPRLLPSLEKSTSFVWMDLAGPPGANEAAPKSCMTCHQEIPRDAPWQNGLRVCPTCGAVQPPKGSNAA